MQKKEKRKVKIGKANYVFQGAVGASGLAQDALPAAALATDEINTATSNAVTVNMN